MNKTLEKLIEQQKLQAELFKKASKPEKRVMIAKDVIANIKVGRFIVGQGYFVDSNFLNNLIDGRGNNELSIQTLLAENKLNDCKVCALGGLVLSCTIFNNKTKIKHAWNDLVCTGEKIQGNKKISNGLNSFFTNTQLKLIEVAFECGEGYFGYLSRNICNVYGKNIEKAIAFGNRFINEKNRLIAIMENIIKNKGTFVP